MRSKVQKLRLSGIPLFSLAICLGLVAAPGSGFANDGFYELASGGLRLSKAENITILREDLRISFERISVTYQISNLDNRRKQAVIGFPLPHPVSLDSEFDGPGPEGIFDMLRSFRITVNDEPVVPEGTDIAIVLFPPISDFDADLGEAVYGTLDITDLLQDAGLELDPENVDLSRLDDEQFAALIRSSLPEPYRGNFPGWWEIRQIPYWTQEFGPKETLTIAHSYTPAPGGMISSGYDVEPGGRLDLTAEQIDYERENALYEMRRLRDNWRRGSNGAEISCSVSEKNLGEVMKQGLQDLLKSHIAADIIDTEQQGFLSTNYSFMTYVLSTATSWTGAIGEFHLTIDGGGLPVLFCLPGEIRLTDPEKYIYEVTLTDFTPTTDLEIVRPF